MSIKNNTTSLQSLLEAVNALPEAENLDTEISTQTTLLSEQDTKIAQLAEILASKASGSSSSDELCTITFYDPDNVAHEGDLYCLYLNEYHYLSTNYISDGVKINTCKNSFILFITSDTRFIPGWGDIMYDYSGAVGDELCDNQQFFGYSTFGEGTTGSVTIRLDDFLPEPI